jgi:hypothetical protein
MKRFLLLNLIAFLFVTTFAKNTGFLGVVINDYNKDGVTGVSITNSIENGAAQKFGLLENDVITTVNNIVVKNKAELVAQIASYDLGNEVTLTYLRNGKLNSAKVILGKKPELITYQLQKNIKTDGEHWYFPTDKLELILKSDNSLIAIAKTDETGKTTETIKVENNSIASVVPQFPGIEDKFQAIKSLKKEREKCGCDCQIKQYTYPKITPDVVEIKKPITSTVLIPERFTVSPNPTSGRITVDFSSKESGTPQLLIMDITGRMVQQEVVQNFSGEFSKSYNLESEARGAYIIQLKIGDKLTSKKIILQ